MFATICTIGAQDKYLRSLPPLRQPRPVFINKTDFNDELAKELINRKTANLSDFSDDILMEIADSLESQQSIF